MKRSMLLLFLVTFGVILATANAFMQSDLRPRPGAPQNPRRRTAVSNELPRTHLNQNRLHKLILKYKDLAVYNQLAKANAIRGEFDYGSYKLLVVDEAAVGGRAALQTMPVTFRDDQNMIVLNGYLIDTSNIQPLSRELPADLKQSRISQALAGGVAPDGGLYIVQFAGPVQDSWLKVLENTGVAIIAYVPNNAYIVRAGERAAGELIRMKASSPFVQWLGDYEAGYKLTPELQAKHERGDSQPVMVTVQLIDGPETSLLSNRLRASALQYFGERRVLKYRNVTALIPASQLVELARSDEVFAIEEKAERVRLDEIQGQIIAGNLSGNAPSGPGYLAWLAGKGFDSSQFGSFSVNVVDDAPALKGHPDLPDSRVAFEHNPTGQPPGQSGHGFLNAHIAGGFNAATGSAYEDADGFNYGLGIAPWARVGVTAIFGSGRFSPTEYEDAAYGAGARISSNSWGLFFTYFYNTTAQEFDSIVRDAQVGTDGNQQLTVAVASSNDGPFADTVVSPATAKNVITVGASEGVRPGNDGCGISGSATDSVNDIAYFSGRGPVNLFGGDGRIKPDIVAPGTHIEAGVPQMNYLGGGICNQYFPFGQTLYGWSSGTSHSTPAVAGGAALVHQDFLNKGMEAPSPAMVKAVLMNSASYLTGQGAGDTLPSPNQGMGLMNLGRTFDDNSRLLIDQTRILGSSGETHQTTGSIASANEPFRVTLVWTDAPGSTISAPWVNDLDLEVTVNDQTYLGNVFSGGTSITGGTADGRNNVESVLLPAGALGSFTVTVRAANIAGDGVPGNSDLTDQDFALVIYNATGQPPDSPIIAVRPARLNFEAVAGGFAPANRTVSIINNGIDTLEWAASVNASWLSVSPTSGAAPSALTVSVDIGGLPAGTYNGAIIINSPNASNSPFTVPVTLAVLPVFRVTPSSLTFLTPFGAGNPASQNISVSHNDDRLRDWTASADASWITVGPTGGIAPSTLTVSVDAGGLPIGTHTGIITISSTNPSVPPVLVPVTLGIDRILNGGIEGSTGTWVFSGVAMRSTGIVPHNGAAYLLLGGANSSNGFAYQQAEVPRHSSINLSFWLNVTSSETAMESRDKLFVEVCNKSGKVLATLATFSNLDSSAPGSYTLRGGYSLANFAGQAVRIRFRTTTDPSSVTHFRIDDVSAR